MKTKKRTFNSEKAFNNFVKLAIIVTIAIVAYKIGKDGISFISTTGLLG